MAFSHKLLRLAFAPRNASTHTALPGWAALCLALLAGVLVGVIQGLASAYLDPLVGGALGSVFPFIIMLLMLLIRPTGLFGWKTIERV